MKKNSACASGICRGMGKILAKITATNVSSDTKFVSVAKSEDGRDIPCRISEIKREGTTQELVVILPILAIKMDLKLIAVVDGGEEVVFSRMLNPATIKVRSKFNRLQKSPFIQEVEKASSPDYFNYVAFDTRECIDARDYYSLCGIMRMAHDQDCSIAVESYDNYLNPIEGRFFVVEDSIDESLDKNVATVRQLTFRYKIPKVMQDCLLVVRNLETGAIIGFDYYEEHILHNLVDCYHNRIKASHFDPEYHNWFCKARVTDLELKAQKQVDFEVRPLFSIVVPLYKTPVDFFDAMVDSVLNQSYDNLELILVNASPECFNLSERVDELAKKDSRVKTVTLEKNLGITENTNAGVAVATGDFVSFLDHDDVLELNLFYEYVKAINENSDIDVLYCDEDLMVDNSLYKDPIFKPDFNIDLLYCCNYMCHLLTVRKTIIDSYDLPTKQFDGAQDFNTVLRSIEKARAVHHVQRVLYHWRQSSSSTAGNAGQKSYAVQAGILALEEHISRTGLQASVQSLEGHYCVYSTRFMAEGHPLVSIVIPVLFHVEGLLRCVESLFQVSIYDNIEVLLVENGDTTSEVHRSCEDVQQKYSQVRIVNDFQEFNVSKMLNFGVSQAKGDYVLLLNSDIEVMTPGFLPRMLGLAARSDVGAVGAKLVCADGLTKHAGIAVTSEAVLMINSGIPKEDYGLFALSVVNHDVTAVVRACLLINKDTFNQVNGFSEDFPDDFNDVDFCMKLKKEGFLNVQCNELELCSNESPLKTSHLEENRYIQLEEARAKFNAKWSIERLSGDEYVNRNLDQSSKYYALPPRSRWPENVFCW